jgi:hypothetical protein
VYTEKSFGVMDAEKTALEKKLLKKLLFCYTRFFNHGGHFESLK